MDERRSRPWGNWCVSLGGAFVVLVAIYVHAYYSTATPMPSRRGGPVGVGYTVYESKPIATFLAVHKMFGPIHWLDRRLRPNVWNP